MVLSQIYIKNEYGLFKMDKILSEMKKEILKNTSDNTIYSMTLFGSYCKGLQSDDSDIDICLIYDEKNISQLDINLIVDSVADNLLDKYGVIIHILCFTKEYYDKNRKNSRLFLDIDREGILC